MAQKQAKLLINIGKIVVGGTGLEPVLIVSYLVINVHIVSYLQGYDGYVWSNFVIKIYIVSYAFCEHFVNRTENFVNSLSIVV